MPEVQIGHTEIGGTPEAVGQNYPFGNVLIEYADPGEISSAFVYLDNPAGGGTQKMRVVLWPTSAGVPTGNARAASVEVIIADGQAGGWVEFTFAAPVAVAPGESLLLGIWGGDTDLNVRVFLISGNPIPNINYWANHNYVSTGLPSNTWNTGANGNSPNASYSAYAVLDAHPLQKLRPVSDIDTTGWATAPLWSKVEEETADGTVITGVAS